MGLVGNEDDASLLQQSKSFTLIELLVVVAVIGILIAMLLPALQRAKEQGKRAVCLEHIKQVGVATLMMGDDNNGWLNGVGTPYGPDGTTCTNMGYWIDTITNYLGRSANLVKGGTGGTPGCPSRDPRDTWWPFAANNMFVGWYYCPTHSLTEVTHPSRIFLLTECYFWYPGSPTSLDFMMTGNLPGAPGNVVAPRHKGEGLNFFFVDGHGEFLKAGQWYKIPGAKQWFVYNVWDACCFPAGIWGE